MEAFQMIQKKQSYKKLKSYFHTGNGKWDEQKTG